MNRTSKASSVVVAQGLATLASQAYLICVSAIVVPLWGAGTFAMLYTLDTAVRAVVIGVVTFVADHFSDTVTIKWCDAVRVLSLGALALVPASDSIAWLVVPVMLYAAASAVVPSLLPAVLVRASSERREQRAYLANWSVWSSVARLSGPAMAAVLLPWLDPSSTLLIAAAISLISFLIDLVTIRGPKLESNAQGPGKPRSFWAGYTEILKSRTLTLFTVLDIVHILLPVAAWMLILQIPSSIGLRPGEQGWLLSSFAIGGLVGGILAKKWEPRRLAGAIVLTQGAFVFALVSLALGSGFIAVLVASAFIGGCGNEVSSVWTNQYIADTVDSSTLGRVFSVQMLVSVAAMPIGIPLASWLLKEAGLRTLVISGGAVLILSSGIVLALIQRISRRPECLSS